MLITFARITILIVSGFRVSFHNERIYLIFYPGARITANESMVGYCGSQKGARFVYIYEKHFTSSCKRINIFDKLYPLIILFFHTQTNRAIELYKAIPFS